MGWVLGVDLGTTFTAAAAWREGRAEILSLGTHSAAVPSVVLFREDGSTMFGDAAELRSVTEPERVAREFKRRVGDSTPLMVGGSPRSPESVMAVLLRAVVDASIELEGSKPDRIAVTHPASWGHYKLDVLRQAIHLAELGVATELVPEPVAAAVHYATLQRIDTNDFVAVYDLGGGTFDAAVVRRTADGFDLYGEPEGIERLGGIDVDAAVFNHVQAALGLQVDSLDRDDPAIMSAFARLRADCVAAKEALSADTDAVIPVMLPGLATEVRITRSELETMIRPAIRDTIGALRRAITSGGLVPEHLARVLLVGGSSRIPLVGEMVNADLGRPVALDVHPKHAVALGAAITAAPKPVAAPAPGPVFAPPPPAPPPAPLPPPPSPAVPPFAPQAPAASKRWSPALIALVGAAVLMLFGVAYALTQSGGSDKVASSSSSSSSSSTTTESSSSSSSDTSDSSSSSSFSDAEALAAAENAMETLFTFDSGNVQTLAERMKPLATGNFLDQLNSFSSDFASSVQSADAISDGVIADSHVEFFDGETGDVVLTVHVELSSGGSTDSETHNFQVRVTITAVDGELLVSEVVDCSTGSSSPFNELSTSDSTASC